LTFIELNNMVKMFKAELDIAVKNVKDTKDKKKITKTMTVFDGRLLNDGISNLMKRDLDLILIKIKDELNETE